MSRSALLFIFWVAAVVSITGQLAVLRSVLLGRAPAASNRRGARWVEAGWALLPTVVLVVVLMWTWRVLSRTSEVIVPISALS
jgi:hypothetical protein